jgi:hypothetical protein
MYVNDKSYYNIDSQTIDMQQLFAEDEVEVNIFLDNHRACMRRIIVLVFLHKSFVFLWNWIYFNFANFFISITSTKRLAAIPLKISVSGFVTSNLSMQSTCRICYIHALVQKYKNTNMQCTLELMLPSMHAMEDMHFAKYLMFH